MNLDLFDKRKLRIRLEGGERAGRAVSWEIKEGFPRKC
jgi:hypothetical protein